MLSFSQTDLVCCVEVCLESNEVEHLLLIIASHGRSKHEFVVVRAQTPDVHSVHFLDSPAAICVFAEVDAVTSRALVDFDHTADTSNLHRGVTGCLTHSLALGEDSPDQSAVDTLL